MLRITLQIQMLRKYRFNEQGSYHLLAIWKCTFFFFEMYAVKQRQIQIQRDSLEKIKNQQVNI